MHNIGQTIANLRKEKGWTQAQLAEKLNISDKAVSKWEIEGGTPSVEFFPLLAEVFGVTCDYLLTGKKSEVITSELELAVKNGNSERAVKLCGERDGQDKSVLDYAIKYKDKKMAEEIIYACSMRDLKIENGGDYIDMIMRLLPLQAERAFISRVNYLTEKDRARGYRSEYKYPKELRAESDFESLDYSPVIEYLVENYDKLEDEQKKYYFGGDIGKDFQSWWAAYPRFIVTAYKKGKTELFKKLAEKLSKQSQIFNEERKKRWEKVKGLRRDYGTADYSYYNDRERLMKQYNAIPSDPGFNILRDFLTEIYDKDEKARDILIKLFENKCGGWSSDDGEFKEFIRTVYRKHGKAEGNRLSAVFWEDITEDEIRCLLIEGDESKSKAQKTEEKCVYEGILWLEKAFELLDAATLKKYLNKYPLTLVEKYEKEVLAYDYKSLYRFAVDKGFEGLANTCVEAACCKQRDLFKGTEDSETAERRKINIYNRLFTEYGEISDEVLVQVLKSNRERLLEYGREKNSLDFVKKYRVDIAKILRETYTRWYSDYQSAVKIVPSCLNEISYRVKLDSAYADFKKFLNEFKTRTLEKLTAAEETKNTKTDNKVFKELTEEYFNTEYKNGNFDFVIIKLCTRIEAYFRLVSGYEGTLHEMMDKYCTDVCGNNSSDASRLHKLRIARNAAAHFEGGEKKIQPAEIPEYIKFVMELTEENNG